MHEAEKAYTQYGEPGFVVSAGPVSYVSIQLLAGEDPTNYRPISLLSVLGELIVSST